LCSCLTKLRIPVCTYFLEFVTATLLLLLAGVHRSIADSARRILRQVRVDCSADDSGSHRVGDRVQLSAGRRRRRRLLHTSTAA